MRTPKAPASLPPLLLTKRDMQRLRDVTERYASSTQSAAAESLELELDRAEVVPEERLPPDVVTMRSRIVCRQLETGKEHELTLVYPHEANAGEGKVSILAPVGLALLGMRVGSTIRWPLPHGRSTQLQLLDVPYQPEAAGQLDP